MKIILVRHGETESNKTKVIQGHLHGALSDLGKEQAKLVGEKLKDENLGAIYSSDLKRTMDTAKEIHKFHDVDLIPDKTLRERSFGCLEGKPSSDYKEIISELSDGWINFKPEGGESKREVHARVSGAFDRIAEKNDKDIVLVSHGGALFCLMHHLCDEPLKKDSEYWHSNTGVTYLEKDGDKWKIVKFNDTEHLE
jgi:broad specificity phosphatase PhoE